MKIQKIKKAAVDLDKIIILALVGLVILIAFFFLIRAGPTILNFFD